MHFTTSTVLVASAAGLVAASAIPNNPPQVQGFTVQQVSAGKQLKRAPALAILNTYAKFGKAQAAPNAVKSAAAAQATGSQSGTVAANPEAYDESYLCPVTVGGKTLNLDFDTGSADLWVYSTLQPTSQQSGHAIYNPSTGTVKSGYTWSITYGDGSGAGGKVYSDKVVVGSVTATSQAVEAATSVSSSFLQDTANDGLLGLAFSSINTVRPQSQTTFFDTVKSTLASKLFTAKLRKGAPGTYTFGKLDSTQYTGAITYVPVSTTNGFWEFTAGTYAVGTGATSSATIGDSIADTGTTLLYLPAATVSAYYAKVSGSSNSAADGGYIFPCAATLPNFVVTIGGTKFTVPGSYINYTPVDGTNCFGGIQSNTGIGFSIFGDIFLKSVFAVFDQTQSTPRLGFATQS